MQPTTWTLGVDLETNSKALIEERLWMEELCDMAVKHIGRYKEDIKKRYDKKFKSREFCVGDWVLKKVSRLTDQGKLDENWQGPYVIEKVGTKGAYILRDLECIRLEYPWNASHLKLFYR